MSISVIVPAHNEEAFLEACLDSIDAAAARVEVAVEVIVVLNRCTDRTGEIARARGCRIVHEDAKILARIRNAGAAIATGTVLVTIDADSRMHPDTFSSVLAKLASGRFVGGGTLVLPDRISLGIVCSAVAVLPYLIRHGLSYGLFWMSRSDFEAIGGFDESLVSVEDVDLVRRLKRHGRARGQRFGTLWRAPIRSSTRKFDQFGDWFLLRNPRFLRRVFTGRDREAADLFWYEARSASGRTSAPRSRGSAKRDQKSKVDL